MRIRIVFAWIRIRFKVCPGTGFVTNFFTSWIQIRVKMIRIRLQVILLSATMPSEVLEVTPVSCVYG